MFGELIRLVALSLSAIRGWILGLELGPLDEAPPTGRPEPAPTAVMAIESGFKPLRRCTACNPRPNSAADAGRSTGSKAIAFSMAEHTASGIPCGRRFGTRVFLILM